VGGGAMARVCACAWGETFVVASISAGIRSLLEVSGAHATDGVWRYRVAKLDEAQATSDHDNTIPACLFGGATVLI
jgi:hypothetical protein